MDTIAKKIFITLMTSSLLLASSLSSAKQVEIGVGAIAVDANIIGKGKFVVNDTVDEGDGLKTGDEGNTTILFNDESMLTLGPGAHASIEAYEEGKNGKSGRSVIRVHKGQFRYFPGNILESGGAQFIAVGNKLLGKKNISPSNSPAGGQNPASGNSSDNSNDASNNQAPSDNTHSTGTQEDVVASDIGKSPEQDQDSNNNKGDNPGSDNSSNAKFGEIQTASTGTASTGTDGGTGGVVFKEHKDDPLHAQFNNQANVLANSNTPAPEPTTPDSDNDAPKGAALITQLKGGANLTENDKHKDISFLKKGIAAFAESGLSGTVKNGQGNFSGSADVFNKAGRKIGALSSATKNKNGKSLLGANKNIDKTVSFATSETFESTPIYDVPIYTIPTVAPTVTPVEPTPPPAAGRRVR